MIQKQVSRALCLVLSLILLLSAMPSMVFAATTVLPAGSTSVDLQAAVNASSFGDDIIISSNMPFLGAVTIPVGLEVTIRSSDNNNWSLLQSVAGTRHFIINGSLILENITVDGQTNGGGVQLNQGAFAMLDGAIIQNCAANEGAAVRVTVGVFSMYGGEIRNNYAFDGGGVYLANGMFNMTGTGIISGNEAEDVGGGVYVNSGLFSFAGGTITNNVAQVGGGVCMAAGLFSVTGGTFSQNTADLNGGAIFVSEDASLNMDNATDVQITGNTATTGGGGGIYTELSDYSNITTNSNVVFSGNRASAAYMPPADAATLYPNIEFAETTIFTHPLNNYDINYKQGDPVEITYNIYYYANGGTGSFTGPDTPIDETDTVLALAATGITRPGYTFVNWNTQPDGGGTSYAPGDEIVMVSDVQLYAQWSQDSYVVAYDSNGGTPVASETVSYGETATEPADPTRTGYTFAGWYTDDGTFLNAWDFDTDVVTENMILHAKWNANLYIVSFDSHGGTPVASETCPYGETAVEPNAPTRAGYTFAGWYTDDGTFLDEWEFDTDVVTENITLHAKWNANGYTVTFDSNGGSSVASQLHLYGETVTRPANPTRSGYTFAGWYTDNGTFQNAWNFNTDVVTSNITLYAKWVKNPTPKTGDSNMMWLWFTLAIASFAGAGGGWIVYRKKRHS